MSCWPSLPCSSSRGLSHRESQYCVLRIAYCVLRIAYCVLRIAYCVLRIAWALIIVSAKLIEIPPLTVSLNMTYYVLSIAYYVYAVPQNWHTRHSKPFCYTGYSCPYKRVTRTLRTYFFFFTDSGWCEFCGIAFFSFLLYNLSSQIAQWLEFCFFYD